MATNTRNSKLDKKTTSASQPTSTKDIFSSPLTLSQVASPKIMGARDSHIIILSKLGEIQETIMHFNSRMDTLENKVDTLISLREASESEEAGNKALKLKDDLQPDWNQKLKNFASAIFNKTKCEEKAELYKKWIEDTPDYLPLKFRPIKLKNGNPSVETIRMKDAQHTYRSEVQSLLAYAESHNSKIQLIQQEMKCIIEASTDIIMQQDALLRIWNHECEVKQETSLSRWANRKKFLIEKREEALANGIEMTKDKDSKIKTDTDKNDKNNNKSAVNKKKALASNNDNKSQISIKANSKKKAPVPRQRHHSDGPDGKHQEEVKHKQKTGPIRKTESLDMVKSAKRQQNRGPAGKGPRSKRNLESTQVYQPGNSNFLYQHQYPPIPPPNMAWGHRPPHPAPWANPHFMMQTLPNF